MAGYRVAALGHVDIERAAATARRTLDIDPLLPLPGLQLFERLDRYHLRVGAQTLQLTYGVEQELPEGALACARYEEADNAIALVLSAETYNHLERGDGRRARFSVAHEIGHAVLHGRRLVELAHIDHAQRAMLRTDASDTPIYRDSEWQANAFAAALLVPGPGLEWFERRGKLNAQALQATYQVSYACAKRRVRTFNKHRQDVIRGWE